MNALEPGTLISDRFEIAHKADSGGMGTVYRARDLQTSEWVALKLLRSVGGAFQEEERFARESRLLAELHHPNIVSYVFHGRTREGRHFLAMEWLEGETLAQRLTRGPLPLRQSITLLSQLCKALAVAHSHGVIHRDLKPTNLFLPQGRLDRVKVLDFGIARRMQSSRPPTAVTQAGMIIGTPEYMAPEQARGAQELTPAADIFSLGCLLYECLTGKPPFLAEHIAAVLVRILFEEPVPLEQRRRGVPAPINRLLNRMLAKEPAARFADARALGAALAELGPVTEEMDAAATVVAQPAPLAFAGSDQQLFSIVIASSSLSEAQRPTEDGSSSQQRATLQSALLRLGAKADFLLDGSLVVTFATNGSATDQAVQAARAALLIKERWPAAKVALTTGRGAVHGQVPVGEVVDRAAQLLAQSGGGDGGEGAPRTHVSGTFVDELSAGLLERRFALAVSPGGLLLTGEELAVDESRPLLGRPTPCVGREAELGMLESHFAACIEDSDARVVLVTAPPGAGKSRLWHELLRRISGRERAKTLLIGQGDLMSPGAPYGILAQALRRLCGLSGGESLGEQQRRLRARVGQHAAPAEQERIAEFLGELCGIPFADESSARLRAAREDPKIMNTQLRHAFLDWLSAEARVAPVLLVLDDLHWGDALSISLLEDALRTLASSPLMILALARPEIHSAFPRLFQNRKLHVAALKELGKKARERLILQALGGQISTELVSRLSEQSAGNALYLEELIRAVAAGKSDSQPQTVVAMLQSRLGRLGAGPRRILRAASIYGQSFWRGGVAALLGPCAEPGAAAGGERATSELEYWLMELCNEEMIQRAAGSRLPGELEFRFRHALMREAAYSLLTTSDQAAGHRLAGSFLEASGERDPMVIAEHYQRGGDLARAVSFYIRAAEQAFDSYDLDGALLRVERGIACAAQGEERGILRGIESRSHHWLTRDDLSYPAGMEALALLTPGSRHWCAVIWHMLSTTSSGPPEWQQRFPELVAMLSRTEPANDARGAYTAALSWLVSTFVWIGQLGPAHAFMTRLQTIGAQESQSDPVIQRWVLQAQASLIRYSQARPWSGLELCKLGIDMSKQAGDLRAQLMFHYYCELTVYELGHSIEAIRSLRKILEVDLPRDDLMILLLTQSLCFILSTQPEQAAQAEAFKLASEIIPLTHNMPWLLGASHDVLARVKLREGRLAEAEADARTACSTLVFAPAYVLASVSTLIYALLAQSKHAEAREVAEQGLERVRQVGCAGYNEVGLRVAASEALFAAGEPERARGELGAALEQLALRAADIHAQSWRASYLNDTWESARARELAARWQVPTNLG